MHLPRTVPSTRDTAEDLSIWSEATMPEADPDTVSCLHLCMDTSPNFREFTT